MGDETLVPPDIGPLFRHNMAGVGRSGGKRGNEI
ncbi:MAG: hypothetical protein JWQ55_4960 [Rhodopila sp.]|nr:hypothetical protein [Rhodopila sp.]